MTKVQQVAGIVNGTTNFILGDGLHRRRITTRPSPRPADSGTLRPTPPPTSRLRCGSKAAILASIAFYTRVTADDVYRDGITEVTAADLAAAQKFDCTVKLLAICERIARRRRRAGFRSCLSGARPLSHPLASVSGAFNAVVVEAENAGRLMFYGQGAGGAPTASAVMGDLVMAARNKVHGGRGPLNPLTPNCRRPIDDAHPPLRVDAGCRPAWVLAQVAGGIFQAFGGVSPRCVRRAPATTPG